MAGILKRYKLMQKNKHQLEMDELFFYRLSVGHNAILEMDQVY